MQHFPFISIYLLNHSKTELCVFVHYKKLTLISILFSKISEKFNESSKCITGIENMKST